jgi:hypothetical protein
MRVACRMVFKFYWNTKEEVDVETIAVPIKKKLKQ